MKRLSWIVPLSIALIFLLLFDAFKSVKQRAAHHRQHPVRADRRHLRAAA